MLAIICVLSSPDRLGITSAPATTVPQKSHAQGSMPILCIDNLFLIKGRDNKSIMIADNHEKASIPAIEQVSPNI